MPSAERGSPFGRYPTPPHAGQDPRLVNRFTAATAAAVLTLTLAGCAASYDERMQYLRKVAQRGADTHKLMVEQEAPIIDKKRCETAYEGVQGPHGDAPYDLHMASYSGPWLDQIKEFWVDSCVSGKPKPVPGDPVPPPSASSSATTTVPTSR